MLLILAEADAFNTSGAYDVGGLRPPLPKWGRRPSAAGPIWGIHYAPLVLKALASARIKSIGHHLF